MQELAYRLFKDLEDMGIDIQFTLQLKEYSKCYYGRYNPKTRAVTLYVYKDKEKREMFSYEHLLETLLHEVVHDIQWNNGEYVRRKGVMHDPEFYQIFNLYKDRMKAILLMREVRYGTICPALTGSDFKNFHCYA